MTEIKDFVIIPIHTPPEAAVKEIDELYDVYQTVSQHWQTQVKYIINALWYILWYINKTKALEFPDLFGEKVF